MAKRIKREDLERLLEHSLRTALSSDISGCSISIDSISATIKVINDSIAQNILVSERYDTSPFSTFEMLLKRHAGENLKAIIVKKDKQIVVQVNYEIIE